MSPGPEDQSGARAATIVRFCKPTTGFEPVTSSVAKEVLYRLSYMGPCIATDPARGAGLDGSRLRRFSGAGNGIRTRDPELGRLALYQLSYSRPRADNDYWWRGEDSNLRRRSPAIYSLIPLATREPLRSENFP